MRIKKREKGYANRYIWLMRCDQCLNKDRVYKYNGGFYCYFHLFLRIGKEIDKLKPLGYNNAMVG